MDIPLQQSWPILVAPHGEVSKFNVQYFYPLTSKLSTQTTILTNMYITNIHFSPLLHLI